MVTSSHGTLSVSLDFAGNTPVDSKHIEPLCRALIVALILAREYFWINRLVVSEMSHFDAHVDWLVWVGGILHIGLDYSDDFGPKWDVLLTIILRMM